METQAQHQQHADRPGDHGRGAEVLLDAVAALFVLAAHGLEGEPHAFHHGFEQRDQRPDGGHADGAGADEAYLVLPERERIRRHVHVGGLRGHGREVGHQHAPGDGDAQQDGDAAGQVHQEAGSQQCQRIAHGQLEDGGATLEPVAGTVGHDAQAVGAEAHEAGDGAAQRDLADAAVGRAVLGVFMAAGLQDLGGCHTLGVGQRAVDHHGVTQRDGEDHTQDAARGAQQHRLPERETAPVAGHQQAGQDEDHRGQRAGGRCLGLHHVVFQDVAAARKAQQCHRDHRGRDGRGKGQAHLQTQVDVGGREHDRDQCAQHHAAQRQLAVIGIGVRTGRGGRSGGHRWFSFVVDLGCHRQCGPAACISGMNRLA